MSEERILIVDDEPKICGILSALIEKQGAEVKVVHTGEDALEINPVFLPRVILLDMIMPGMNGLECLEKLKTQFDWESKVIIMTAHGEVRSAVDAMKKGAFDYLQKHFDNDELLAVISRALEMVSLAHRVKQLEDQLDQTFGFDNIVGVSGKIKSVFARMRKFAVAEGTVLVTGESGTGKELVVRAIHQASRRKKGPYIVVNCGAIPAGLIESEFFGYEAGTFTDAKSSREGKFEAAHGGTLFLDEVGELPLEAQVKLLRVLEDGEFMRLGSNASIKVDVRVMAATNQDLSTMVEKGTFRGDLFWRLNVLSLNVCPLRDRREDIFLLIDHFLEKFAASLAREIPSVSKDAMETLTGYNWPGNVRELQNCIYCAVATLDSNQIEVDDLPSTLFSSPDASPISLVPSGRKSLAELASAATSKSDQEAIRAALEETAGNKEKAAQLLGIGRKTLYRKLKQYGMV